MSTLGTSPTRPSSWRLLLLFLALVVTGASCQSAPVSTVLQPVVGSWSPYVATVDDVLSLTSDALVIERFVDDALVEQQRIPAELPQLATWGAAQDSVFWVEPRQPSSLLPESQADDGFVIRSINLNSGEPAELYWTRQPVTGLSVSPQSQVLAFFEGEQLFVLSLETLQVERVTEHALSYQWSPQVTELIVQTTDDWWFVDVDESARVTEQRQLAPSQRILGVTYADRRELLAVVAADEDRLRGVHLVSLGLTTDSVTELDFLRSLEEVPKAVREASASDTDPRPPQLETDPTYQLWVSPTTQLVLVDQYTPTTGEHQQFLYNRDHRRRRPVTLPGRLLAWPRDDDMILALPDTLPGQWALEHFAVTSGERSPLGVRQQPASSMTLFPL